MTHDSWDISIEQIVLGAALADNARLDTLGSDLTVDSFYDGYHQRLFGRMQYLRTIGAVNVRTLAADLKTDPGFKETDGEQYLDALRHSCPASPPLKEYIAILKDLASRREALAIGQGLIQDAAMSPSEMPTQRLVGDATQALLSLTGSYRADRTQALSAVTHARLVLAEKRLAGEEVPRLSTGLKRVDKAMGGLQPGDHLVLAARSAMGKTALACVMGRAVAMAGNPVFAISADMTKERWGERTLTELDHLLRNGAYPIKYSHFRGRMASEHISRLAEAQQIIQGWAYDICDEGSITVGRIRAKVQAMANRYPGKQGLLILDFLQKIQPEATQKDRRRDEYITDIAYAIGDIVKDVGWSAISLAQLKNKATDAKGKLIEEPPTEADIRESGGILMCADAVIGIHRKAFFVERREPPGRDFPEKPGDWSDWDAELRACKNDMQLIGFKNRDDAVSRMNMTLFCDLGSNAIYDERPRDWPKPAGDASELANQL